MKDFYSYWGMQDREHAGMGKRWRSALPTTARPVGLGLGFLHSSLDLTAKLYLQLGLRDLLDAVNKLPEF